MFDEIVVPVDGSGFGELALPIALGIACRSGGEVRMVSVLVPLSSPPPTQDGTEAEAERLATGRDEASTYQKELQKRVILAGCDVPISTHVEVGQVVDALDAHARKAGADLLVMTTHGRGPLTRAWLGSVADGLIRRTPCPILAIRPEEGAEVELKEGEFHHILVTLDGSPESREILPYARELCHITGARMTLLRVIPPHFPLGSSFLTHTAHGSPGHEEEREAALVALELEAEGLRSEGFTVAVETVAAPHPAEGILDFSKSNDIDLIAMATHGRGGVARLFLGSVADKVIRGGSFPVLLHRTS